MNAVRKQLSLLNKNAFQQSMIKITWGDEMNLAKEKHFQLIINTLLGQNEKMTQEDGAQIIVDYILQIEVKKWMKSLKTLMLVHRILNIIPKKLQPIISRYVDQPNSGGVSETQGKGAIESNSTTVGKDNTSNSDTSSQRRSGSIPRNSNRNGLGNNKLSVNFTGNKQQIDILHQILVQKYYDYIIIFNEKLDNINYLAGREVTTCNTFSKEFTKIKSLLLLFKHVQSFMRELEISLINFQKVLATQIIACLLSNNLMQSYQILKPIVQKLLDQFQEFDNPSDFIRFFNFYSDFITITKNMSKFNLLKLQLSSQFEKDFTLLELYAIDKDLNRQIELYHLTVKSTKRIPSQRLGTDFISMGVSTHVEDSPLKFTKNNGPIKGIFFHQNKIINNGKCEDNNDDSVFLDPAFKNVKLERPQSAQVSQQKYVLEQITEGKPGTDQMSAKLDSNSQKYSSEQEIKGSSAKDIQEIETKNKISKKNQKDIVSTFKIIKLDQYQSEENGLTKQKQKPTNEQKNEIVEIEKDQKVINFSPTTNQRKPSNAVNDSYKVQSKQFYDMKNNPLSFLKSSSLTKEQVTPSQIIHINEEGGKILKNKCHDDLQYNKNNEIDNEEITISKNVTADCSPPTPLEGMNKQQIQEQNIIQGVQQDFNQEILLQKKKQPVKSNYKLNNYQPDYFLQENK